MASKVAIDAPGKKMLLMGNEAVARGAIEAGCQFASAYPGTPSSEILETLSDVAKDFGMHAQWSTNEMVALWAGAGATYCGQRALVAGKHHGIAWMVDPLINFAHWQIGRGGMVVAIGDDPQGHSSSNEFDSRNLASRVFEIPVLEPADPQEAKDFVKIGFELSEQLKSPIYVRLTTRVCHGTGDVTYGEIPKERRRPDFFATPIELGMEMISKYGWVDMAYLHDRVHTVRLKEAEEISNNFTHNILTINGGEELGIIATGVTRHYVEEAVRKLGIKAAFLQLGMSFPLPTEKVRKLLKGVKKVVVFEETDPVVETDVRSFAKDAAPGVQIFGKISGHTPVSGELNVLKVMNTLAKISGKDAPVIPERADIKEMISPYLGMRRITLCAACPHRASGYVVKKACEALGIDYIGVGDIGCYGMMGLPPILSFQLTNAMGGSIGMANGIAKTGLGDRVIAFIGDSTFYHAGLPSLINASFNNAKFTTVILDNSVTGMTGFQPHPGTGQNAMGEKVNPVSIEALVRACGIDEVAILDPYNITKSIEGTKQLLSKDKASCIIFRRACSTEYLRQRRKQGLAPPKPFYVDQNICNGCMTCVNEFGCPAIIWDDNTQKASIDDAQCRGCANCTQICPQKAIKMAVSK
ncbi:MAG: indolepyruvate ferredoxin oxidoreductase subunit alpha [Candidatus Thermoplasmatota archaeon]|nr:indolepyruvate ferredoxin oxidoreductase subunit alpha [Candidatus Thermoplasmatota archaeon]